MKHKLLQVFLGMAFAGSRVQAMPAWSCVGVCATQNESTYALVLTPATGDGQTVSEAWINLSKSCPNGVLEGGTVSMAAEDVSARGRLTGHDACFKN